MAKIKGAQINNIHSGGIADSLYSGIPNSVATLIGFDIHSKPGSLIVNQKLTKLATIDDFCKKIIESSDGKTYFFGSTTGKIWSRTSGGTITLEATAAPSSGDEGIIDAYEYAGYIYYVMEQMIGRVAIGAPTDWSGRNDSYATFGIGNAVNHPMVDVNDVLYIGDGNQVAQIDDTGTFVADALDLQSQHEITALGKQNTDLVIGTRSGQDKASIFLWNTWSVSYSVEDEVNEDGINAFIPGDNYTLVSAGKKGNIYLLNGYQLELIKRIPGEYSPTQYMTIYPNARDFFNGIPVFGVSNGLGNPCSQGIYSFGSRQAGYPRVLNLEYPISQRSSGEYVTNNIEIGAVKAVGSLLFTSWRDNNSTPVSGVDMLDYSAKLEYGLLESRVMKVDRWMANSYRHWYIGYEELPANTDIQLFYNKNFSDDWNEIDLVNDTIRSMMTQDLSVTASTMQVRVKAITTGNSSPIIDEMLFLFE